MKLQVENIKKELKNHFRVENALYKDILIKTIQTKIHREESSIQTKIHREKDLSDMWDNIK